MPSGVCGDASIEVKVIEAAAFCSGLEGVLVASGIAMLVLAVVAATRLRLGDAPSAGDAGR